MSLDGYVAERNDGVAEVFDPREVWNPDDPSNLLAPTGRARAP
jgi:hypothetical protein